MRGLAEKVFSANDDLSWIKQVIIFYAVRSEVNLLFLCAKLLDQQVGMDEDLFRNSDQGEEIDGRSVLDGDFSNDYIR